MISESKANDEVSGASTQPISNLVRKYFSAYQSETEKRWKNCLPMSSRLATRSTIASARRNILESAG